MLICVGLSHTSVLGWRAGSHDSCKEKAFCSAAMMSWKERGTCRCGYNCPLGGLQGDGTQLAGVSARVLTGSKSWGQGASSMESYGKSSSWGICPWGHNVPNRILSGPWKPVIAETWADVRTLCPKAVAFMRTKGKSRPYSFVEGLSQTWWARGYVFLFLYFFLCNESQLFSSCWTWKCTESFPHLPHAEVTKSLL